MEKQKKKLCPMAQQFFDPRIKNNLTVYKLSKKKKTFNQPL
jgi:hypothetical protein